MAETTDPNPPLSDLPPPTLHHLSSSQSHRILWALEELSAAHGQTYTLHTYTRIKSRAPPELESIFPLGKAPILTVDTPPLPFSPSPDKDRTVVTESRLIMQYLADNYSRGLWMPTAPAEKARDDFWQEFAGSTLGAKVQFPLLFEMVPPNSPFLIRPLLSLIFTPIANILKKDLVAPFELMEAALSEETPWFSGTRMGLADFCMSWPMDVAVRRGYFDGGKYPRVKEWHERIVGREAYKRALEKGGSMIL